MLSLFLTIAGVFGAAGIALAAAGAHRVPSAGLDSAANILLFHALAILGGIALLLQGMLSRPLALVALAAWSFGTFTDGQVITIDVPIANIVVVGPNEMRTVSVSPGVYTVVVSPNEVRVDQVTPILPVEQV